MNKILIKDVVEALEEHFPLRWQEGFDNSGMQVGEINRPCTGALICVDATPEIVIEAYERGCNLVITHHPLIFHPLKNLTGYDRVTRTIYKAIRHDVAIYSCHTPVDNAPGEGVSWELGRLLGLGNMTSLESKGAEAIGCGVVGDLPELLSAETLVNLVKERIGSPTARCSELKMAPDAIGRVAICGGAGNFLITDACEAGAGAFITSDCKHNNFIDYRHDIFLIDIGHFESEKITKQIFYQIIREKFANFALYYSNEDNNPINYL